MQLVVILSIKIPVCGFMQVYALKLFNIFFCWDKSPSMHFSIMLISLFSMICCTKLGDNILVTDGVLVMLVNLPTILEFPLKQWIFELAVALNVKLPNHMLLSCHLCKKIKYSRRMLNYFFNLIFSIIDTICFCTFLASTKSLSLYCVQRNIGIAICVNKKKKSCHHLSWYVKIIP